MEGHMMDQTILSQHQESSDSIDTKVSPNTLYTKQCPVCGFNIPIQVIICWSCGYCFDPYIQELSESQPSIKELRKRRRRMESKQAHAK